jgi:hypothetical protein
MPCEPSMRQSWTKQGNTACTVSVPPLYRLCTASRCTQWVHGTLMLRHARAQWWMERSTAKLTVCVSYNSLL